MKYQLMAACALFSGVALSETPTCHTHPGGNYCQYEGHVQRLYVNEVGTMLLYFDKPIPVANAAAAGFSIANGGATIYKLADNPEFAKLLYSTALSAQSTGRPVTIQMRGVVSGYLKVDRIWLAKP